MSYDYTALDAFEAARHSLQRLDFATALAQLESSLADAASSGDRTLVERTTAALALCRSLITMEQASRELEEAHRHAMELHASERSDIAAALRACWRAGTSVRCRWRLGWAWA